MSVEEKKKEKKAVDYKSKTMQCFCVSSFQDDRYGKNMRLFNKRVKQKKENGYCCTVCGRVTL